MTVDVLQCGWRSWKESCTPDLTGTGAAGAGVVKLSTVWCSKYPEADHWTRNAACHCALLRGLVRALAGAVRALAGAVRALAGAVRALAGAAVGETRQCNCCSEEEPLQKQSMGRRKGTEKSRTAGPDVGRDPCLGHRH